VKESPTARAEREKKIERLLSFPCMAAGTQLFENPCSELRVALHTTAGTARRSFLMRMLPHCGVSAGRVLLAEGISRPTALSGRHPIVLARGKSGQLFSTMSKPYRSHLIRAS
jgi:hypothetical protein